MPEQDEQKPSKQLGLTESKPVPHEAPKRLAAVEQPRSSSAVARRPSKAAERQEFFIPVSGFVWLFPEEVEVTNHPAFQRLGRIYQLGQAYLVYRGATHKRLEHALGALHIVQRMIEAVRHNSDKAELAARSAGSPLSLYEERFTRLGALLHDIGHIAAGHTIEDELGILGKHDADARLDLVFDGKDLADRKGRTLSEVIDEWFSHYVPKSLSDVGVRASHIVRLLIRKPPEKKDADPKRPDSETSKRDALNSSLVALQASDELRLAVCRDMIGNTICADLLDYLHRDWYHVGKPRSFDERILQYMEIRPRALDAGSGVRQPASSDKFVVSLGRRPKIRTDAVSAILDLLEWRYQLAESVLFHRTKLAGAAMLDRALFELWNDNVPADLERILLPLSDEQMIQKCVEFAAARKDAPGRIAERLLNALDKRDLYSHLCTRFGDELLGDATRVQGKFGKTVDGENQAPQERARVLRVLENDFQLPEGSLAMYCPAADMNAKIAEVQIAVGDEVDRFCDFEKSHSDQLTGGHLDAQLHRFRRLWRVHFFIDDAVKETCTTILPILQEAIEKLVLGHLSDDDGYYAVARKLALLLTLTEGSKWNGHKIADEATIAAFRQEEIATGTYPLAGISIRQFIAR